MKASSLDFSSGRSILTKDGSEVPDPRPMALPVGFERPPSIQEMIRRFVTDPQIRAELESHDLESFDEADDFDIADDLVVNSPHEDVFDPHHLLTREQEIRGGAVREYSPVEIAAAKKVLDDHRAAIKAKKEAASKPPPPPEPKA